jgi:hypothetical protein
MSVNYDYFIPITIWKYEKDENQILYRLTNREGNFWSSFVKNKKEDEKLSKIWKKYKVFYAMNYEYFGNYGRGSATVIVGNSTDFPYETTIVTPITKINNNKSYTSFRAFLYPFPETTLLYLSVKENKIHDIVYYDKEVQNDSKINKKYNFLPDSQSENKKVKWSDKYCPFITKFYYVYDFKPTFSHWTPNGENVCLPSYKGYNTISECLDNVRDNVKNNQVFVQTDSLPLYEISTTSKHPYRLLQKNIPSILDLFIIVVILITLLFSIDNKLVKTDVVLLKS